jgi:hypothetical protein
MFPWGANSEKTIITNDADPARTNRSSQGLRAPLRDQGDGRAACGLRKRIDARSLSAIGTKKLGRQVWSGRGETGDSIRCQVGRPAAFPPRSFVASQPCLICGRSPSQAHHVCCAQPRELSLKVSDEFTVPLCAIHHHNIHTTGKGT